MKKAILSIALVLIAFANIAWMGAHTAMQKTVRGYNFTTDANCAGAWYMNEDAATAENDESSNNKDLAVSAGDEATRSATVPTGYAGYSRDFEYTTEEDYLTLADEGGSLDINGADAKVTVACWFKPESVQAATVHNLIGKYDATGNQRQYKISITGDAEADGYTITGWVSADSTSGGTGQDIPATTANFTVASGWHHVAMVCDDSNLYLYVDGVQDCSPEAHTGGIFNGNVAFQVARATVNTFDGLIDECIVLNRALSAAEVAELHRNGISGNKGASD